MTHADARPSLARPPQHHRRSRPEEDADDAPDRWSRPRRGGVGRDDTGPAGVTFESFYADAYDRIAGALVLTLGDRDLGVEAADEAMVRAFQRWAVVGTYDNPGGWCYRVGLNWARSLHRKLSRRLPFHTVTRTDAVEVADPAITAALRALDVRMRAVVVCRLLLDWSVEETATALGIRPGTVKSRLHRGLSTLETILEDLR